MEPNACPAVSRTSTSGGPPLNRDLIVRLHEIGAVKFGSFVLKSGITSPIYLDLRLIVSFPDVLETVGDLMWEAVQDVPFDLLCGVPYTALPMATAISLKHKKPMAMRRKEAKEYGTKKSIEGVFSAGDRCLVVEDLVTSGKSVLETIEPLEEEDLVVEDVVVLIDREQGGRQRLADHGYRLHALFTLGEFLQVLEAEKRLDSETVASVRRFIEETQVTAA